MNKIKFLVIGFTHNYGGMESYFMNVYRNIDRNKIQFDFIVNRNIEVAYKDEIEKLGGNIIPLYGRCENPLMHYWEYNRFFKKNSRKYDGVYLNTMNLVNIDPLLFGRYYGIKTRIIHSHNSDQPLCTIKKILANFHQKRLDKYANVFFACSEKAGKWMFENEKFTVIRNAIDSETYKYNEKIREDVRKKFHWEDKLVIGNVGRIAEQKNPLFSVEIFNEIYKKNKNTICIHIGDGDSIIKEQMEKKIREYGLEDAYYLLGSRKDIPEMYQAMDALLLPSIHEGLPFVLVEAQTAGLPCFVSTEVSKESQLIENQIEFISLEKGAAKWAERVLEKMNIFSRTDGSEKVLKAGYDCKKNAEIVMEQILDYIE